MKAVINGLPMIKNIKYKPYESNRVHKIWNSGCSSIKGY